VDDRPLLLECRITFYTETSGGLYYKPTSIINDNSRVVNKLETSLTDDARVTICDRHMFIVQATSGQSWIYHFKYLFFKLQKIRHLWQIITIGLHHPLDGVMNPKYKLLRFIQLTIFCKKKRAQAFNKDRCCHLALCLRLILFYCYPAQVSNTNSFNSNVFLCVLMPYS
jgi:hypothetical protein